MLEDAQGERGLMKRGWGLSKLYALAKRKQELHESWWELTGYSAGQINEN
jgi:hypothetical protein